jgi:hypothetical protein
VLVSIHLSCIDTGAAIVAWKMTLREPAQSRREAWRGGRHFPSIRMRSKLARVGSLHFAPDGSWALSEPPREHFSACYQATRPQRLRFTGAPRVHRVDAAPVPKSLRCHQPVLRRESDAGGEEAWLEIPCGSCSAR